MDRWPKLSWYWIIRPSLEAKEGISRSMFTRISISLWSSLERSLKLDFCVSCGNSRGCWSMMAWTMQSCVDGGTWIGGATMDSCGMRCDELTDMLMWVSLQFPCLEFHKLETDVDSVLSKVCHSVSSFTHSMHYFTVWFLHLPMWILHL